jgi:hypothetical protein
MCSVGPDEFQHAQYFLPALFIQLDLFINFINFAPVPGHIRIV